MGMMAESKLYSTVTEVTMSLLPEHHEHRHAFEVKVRYVGRALWEVVHFDQHLMPDGETWIPLWVPGVESAHAGLWTQHEATRLARSVLPGLRVRELVVRDGEVVEVVEVPQEEIST
jgi:hypothetical protein